MANTEALSKEERKKSKRAARKKATIEKPKKKRDYARGSQEAQSEEDGARPGETLRIRTSTAVIGWLVRA